MMMRPRPVGGMTDTTVHAMFWLIPQGSLPMSNQHRATNGPAAMTMPTYVLV